MASVVCEVELARPADEVWDAVRDFGGVRERLVPGFLTDVAVEREGAVDVRTVTFFNGQVVRERLVAIDDDHRRLTYTNELPGIEHHAASVQVGEKPGAAGGSRLVWITDVLPHEAAGPIREMMRLGIETLQRTLDGAAVGVGAGPTG